MIRDTTSDKKTEYEARIKKRLDTKRKAINDRKDIVIKIEDAKVAAERVISTGDATLKIKELELKNQEIVVENNKNATTDDGKKVLNDAKNKVTSLKAEINKLKEEIEKAKSDINRYEKVIKSKQDEVVKISEEIKKIEDEEDFEDVDYYEQWSDPKKKKYKDGLKDLVERRKKLEEKKMQAMFELKEAIAKFKESNQDVYNNYIHLFEKIINGGADLISLNAISEISKLIDQDELNIEIADDDLNLKQLLRDKYKKLQDEYNNFIAGGGDVKNIYDKANPIRKELEEIGGLAMSIINKSIKKNSKKIKDQFPDSLCISVIDYELGAEEDNWEKYENNFILGDTTTLIRLPGSKLYRVTQALNNGEIKVGQLYKMNKFIELGKKSRIYILLPLKMKNYDKYIKYNQPIEIKSDNIDQNVNLLTEYMIKVYGDVTDLCKNINNIVNPKEAHIIDKLLSLMQAFQGKESEANIYKYLYVYVSMIYIRIVQKISMGSKLNTMDYDILINLGANIGKQIQLYNSINNTAIANVTDGLNALEDITIIDEMIYKLEENVTKPEIYESQRDYETLNQIANTSTKLEVSRGYVLSSDTKIEMTEIMNINDAKEVEIPPDSNIRLEMNKYEIIDKQEFVDKVPDLMINLKSNVKRLFHIIMNKAYIKFPTYRKSTRYNCGIKKYTLIIDGIKYPEIPISGNSDNNSDNSKYIEELSKCIEIENSKINRSNSALDMSTTNYITRKLYGEPSGKIFEFDPESNVRYIFKFGYFDEFLGKFMIGINLNEIKRQFKDEINLEESLIEIEFENEKTDQAEFGEYEIYTIAEYENFEIKIDKNGQRIKD